MTSTDSRREVCVRQNAAGTARRESLPSKGEPMRDSRRGREWKRCPGLSSRATDARDRFDEGKSVGRG